MNKTVLCICTYKRPEGLRRLLDAAVALQEAADLEIVVADNDAEGREGIAVCAELPSDYPFKVHSLVVAAPGLSAARNAVSEHALSLGPDLIAFLDDDEWPEVQWLAELKRIQSHHGAAVVGGPTRPVFPEGTDDAVRNNPYYGADMGLPDGSRCRLEAGGNFLITRDALASLAPTFFHRDFTQSGGEDLAFFMQLDKGGFSMHWAAHAVVHEPVPAERLSHSWRRQRIINIHNSRVRVEQMLRPELPARAIRIAKTCALAGLASLMSVCAAFHVPLRDQAEQLRWKLRGKLGAHCGRKTVRKEQY